MICQAWVKFFFYRNIEELCQVNPSQVNPSQVSSESQWILVSNSHWFFLQPEIKLAQCCLLLDVLETASSEIALHLRTNPGHWQKNILFTEAPECSLRASRLGQASGGRSNPLAEGRVNYEQIVQGPYNNISETLT